MMPTIFSATTVEEREICERMISKNLDLAQRENILLLTGVPKDSPFYSPPAPKKRSILQFIIHHALRFATRVENPPLFPSISVPARQESCLSKPEVVPSGCDPLSASTCEAATCALESPVSVTEETQVASPKVVPYQQALAQAVALLSWRKPTPIACTDALETGPVVSLQTIDAQPRRIHSLSTSTGFVNSTIRSHIFASETDVVQQEMTPLLTPLERAISQAREHGYHLHPRQPLSISTSTSPISPSQRSPPGLAHLKNRYHLRSHQVAAGDYFRKEASHRAAVASRNLNRHQLIKKADRSLYEPSGIIMPDYEITRLRVVLAPKRFPVRLWKKEYRGPADWIEIEEKTPAGGPVIFKRDSHLRKELPLRLKRVAAQRSLAPPVPKKEQRPTLSVETTQKVAAVCLFRHISRKSNLTFSQQATVKLSPVKTSPVKASPVKASPVEVAKQELAPQPSALYIDTKLDNGAAPGCLDPAVAELHRQSVCLFVHYPISAC